MENTGPLKDIKVLDLTMLLPGPLCSQHLGDLGADIIKVENPKVPDMIRKIHRNEIPYIFLLLNRNKSAITVNIKRKEGREIIHKILSDCDVLIEGFRPGAMKKMNLDYENLHKKFPKLIYCSISGFGQDGPYSNLAGHDGNYISYSGILGITGTSDGRPVLPGVQIADIAGGTLIALAAILAALYSREKSGKGQYIDVSMLDGALSMMGLPIGTFLNQKKDQGPGQMMLSGGLANYNIYKTSDGAWLMFAGLEERFLRAFLRSQNKEELLNPLKLTNHNYQQNQKLQEILKNIFSEKPYSYWEKYFDNPELCLSPIKKISEVLEDKQLVHRNMIEENDHTKYGRYYSLGSPFKFSETKTINKKEPPVHGEHTDEILKELGYSDFQISELRKKRVI
jgi:crotonobetainyl-CoA:carnitine CoA-transferase CaiB-like acyl-CoA transferase